MSTITPPTTKLDRSVCPNMTADSRAVNIVAALLLCFFITESANLKKKVDSTPCAALFATSTQVTME